MAYPYPSRQPLSERDRGPRCDRPDRPLCRRYADRTRGCGGGDLPERGVCASSGDGRV